MMRYKGILEMTNKTSKVSDKMWQEFVSSGLVEKGLRPGDYIESSVTVCNYSSDSPKEAFTSLKQILTPDAYKRLNGRWRKYKYSVRNKVTTLTVRQETMEKLKAVAKQSGLGSESYDLILEYLLDPAEDMGRAKSLVDDTGYKSGLNANLTAYLLNAKLRFRRATWENMLTVIRFAFESGWCSCKKTHSKKRTDENMNALMEKFIDNITDV